MNVLWRGSVVQRLRLASGLVLFTFVLTHFLNHAVGLISLDAMIAVDHWRIAVTRSTLGTLVLLAALLTHLALAILRIAAHAKLALAALAVDADRVRLRHSAPPLPAYRRHAHHRRHVRHRHELPL